MQPYIFSNSDALMERARKVIPGGIYGHQNPALLTRGAFPSFFARGQGSHIWDVDGNEYIDYMCSYGPIVLGHRHPKVEEAARRQSELGNCFNAPGPVWVELAEHLVSLTPFADWTVFAKNGSDVCTWAIEVARHATGRPKIAMCEGAYHGTHSWCTPAPAGVTAEDRANLVYFHFNDLPSLQARVDESNGQLAGVIISPFRHDAGHDQELPKPGFFQGVRELCDRNGMVLVLDDVRAGFRLHLGGSGELFGLRPDLATYCKAMGNGYPIAACVGRESLRKAATEVFFTGSYFTSTVPMAASLACLRELAATDGIARMRILGEKLRDGLLAQARDAKLEVTYSGPPAIPYMTFTDDRGRHDRAKLFAGECARHGVYLAPRHNWFLSAAHTDQDIARTLDVTAGAFAAVHKQFAS
ncbi:MAG TPA: aminotransferase class III-fold pyridoxal phosphate-dependent enzyme [Candidatus Binataceae bacterium]|nr:aminotransferase class III-fold pyridoxal phosphate-dependent enzyme [Candidatus Binataceae bacterium]